MLGEPSPTDKAIRDWMRFFQDDYNLTSNELESSIKRVLRERSQTAMTVESLPGTPAEEKGRPPTVSSSMGQVPGCHMQAAPTPTTPTPSPEAPSWFEPDIRPIARSVVVALVAFAAHSRNRFYRVEALIPLLGLYIVFTLQLLQEIRASRCSSVTSATTTQWLDLAGHILVLWSTLIAIPGLWANDPSDGVSAASITWVVGVIVWLCCLLYGYYSVSQSVCEDGDKHVVQPIIGTKPSQEP